MILFTLYFIENVNELNIDAVVEYHSKIDCHF